MYHHRRAGDVVLGGPAREDTGVALHDHVVLCLDVVAVMDWPDAAPQAMALLPAGGTIVLVAIVVARAAGATVEVEAYHVARPVVEVRAARFEADDVAPPRTTAAVLVAVVASVAVAVAVASAISISISIVIVIAAEAVVSAAAVVVVGVSHPGVVQCRAAVRQVGVARPGQEAGVASRIRAIHAAGAPCVEGAVCPGLRAEVEAGAKAEADGPVLRAALVGIDESIVITLPYFHTLSSFHLVDTSFSVQKLPPT